MPIAANELKFFKSTNDLGGAITATEIVTATLQNLFNNITGDESAAGITLYNCIYLSNENGSLELSAVKAWLLQNTPSADTDVAIGLGTSAVNGTEQTIANEETAPAGVTFSSAANEGAALAMPNIPAGQHKALWIRLTVSPGASAVALDNMIIRWKGDTPA